MTTVRGRSAWALSSRQQGQQSRCHFPSGRNGFEHD
jgi:hypothetical protein